MQHRTPTEAPKALIPRDDEFRQPSMGTELPHPERLIHHGLDQSALEKGEIQQTSMRTELPQIKLAHEENPVNWPARKKWSSTIVLVFMTATITFCSSIHTAAIGGVTSTFRCSHTVATLGVTTFLIGFATGPLLFAPLSEVWGRSPVFRITLFLFFCFNLGCALAPNITALLILRFLCGFFGSPVGRSYKVFPSRNVEILTLCSDQHWRLPGRYLAPKQSFRAVCSIYHRKLTRTCYCSNCRGVRLASKLTPTCLVSRNQLTLMKHLAWRW